MEAILEAHLALAIFLGVCVVVSAAIALSSFFATGNRADLQINQSALLENNEEEEDHVGFERRFYLSAIVFVIFVLVIAFLVPWAVSFNTLGWYGLISVALFSCVLSVGFIYGWKKGAFEWD